jgi:hypothetical protein
MLMPALGSPPSSTWAPVGGAVVAADYDMTDPAVLTANRKAYDSLRAFHQSPVDLVPGLSLVFPVPGPLEPDAVRSIGRQERPDSRPQHTPTAGQ